VFDPVETHNLAADPAHQIVLTELRGDLERWMRATDDPLLAGPIPMPEGAVANRLDALSPKDL
jgi:N-sulfoglucosamine sulfohydrolase